MYIVTARDILDAYSRQETLDLARDAFRQINDVGEGYAIEDEEIIALGVPHCQSDSDDRPSVYFADDTRKTLILVGDVNGPWGVRVA